MMRREFLCSSVFSSVFFGASITHGEQSKAAVAHPSLLSSLNPDAPRPNLILILTDDQGYGDVSCYGDTDVQTPNIDQIAREGILFTRMRANCTVCSPTRAAIMTGMYADRVGVPGVIRTHHDNSWGYFSPGILTLADRLRAAGYHTGIVGKWHLGLESPNTPNERGFDFFHGFLGDMMDSYWEHRRHDVNYMRRNAEAIEVEGHATDLFTDWACEYISERATDSEVPFFLYLAYNAPHFPIEPPDDWYERIKKRSPEMEEKRALNVAFVEHLDHAVRRVLESLKENGMEDNTLIVFTSDNGGSLPHAQSNHPWRDGKQSHYDGGLRVPFALRWPERVNAGAVSDYAGLTFDVFPTFLELAGVPLPEDIDAVSLMPILQGEGMDDAERELYFVRREGGLHYGGKSYEALIRGPWKLMQNDPYSPMELYHLDEDPQEQHNLIAERPEVVRELSNALRRHIQRGGVAPWQPPSS